MKFSFKDANCGGFFDVFRAADRERTAPLSYGQIKVRQRGFGADARFCLRLRAGPDHQSQRIEPDQMLALAAALVEVANKAKETPR